MNKFQILLSESVIWVELLCALVALSQYNKVRHTYWKWFVFYVIFIFLAEAFSKFALSAYPETRRYYFDFFVIPFEFLFFFWLYAIKSLQRKNLFLISCGIYLLSFVPHLFHLENTRIINTMSYTVGVLLLMVMIFLEFNKQIQSDAILQFRRNKMFYVNFAIMFFYVGTLPFFTFDTYLYKNASAIWWSYYSFFLIAVNLMYLSFTAAFLWGKQNS